MRRVVWWVERRGDKGRLKVGRFKGSKVGSLDLQRRISARDCVVLVRTGMQIAQMRRTKVLALWGSG
jgi:hypothetical protein